MNTSSFDDPVAIERLRNELFDADAKLAEDIRMEKKIADKQAKIAEQSA